jgi:hypothetical protein
MHFLPVLIREDWERGNVAHFIGSFLLAMRRNYDAQEAVGQSLLLELWPRQKALQHLPGSALLLLCTVFLPQIHTSGALCTCLTAITIVAGVMAIFPGRISEK